MIKSRYTVQLVALGIAVAGVQAETHVVLPGTRIQAKVDIAKDGDSIFIMGGTYGENVSVTKNLDIRRVKDQPVTITGSFTLENLDKKFELANFKIGGDRSKDVIVKNCSDIFLANLDLNAANGLHIEGSKVSASGCVIGQDVRSHNSTLTLIRSTVKDNIDTHTGGKLILFQSTFHQKMHLRAIDSWIGYNEIRSIYIEGGESHIIVGNTIDARNEHGIECRSGANMRVCNNRIRNANLGIYLHDRATSHVYNNIIHNCSSHPVYIHSASKMAWIKGNIIYKNRHGLDSPFDKAVVSHNNFRNQNYSGGVIPTDHQWGMDPKFVNEAEGDFRLQEDSPCKDAGPSEAWFNDRDGSRNDIGLFGGPFYDPNGRTTTLPVVLSMDIEPFQLIKGIDTTITLKSRGIVVPE